MKTISWRQWHIGLAYVTAILAIAAVCGCSKPLGDNGPEFESEFESNLKTSAVTIVTSPADGDVDVSEDVKIQATFSKEMDESSLAGAMTLTEDGGETITGTTTYDATAKVFTLAPSQTLKWGATYIGKVAGGAKSIDGTSLSSPYAWKFTVGKGWIVTSSGYDHTCALKNGGSIYCWGVNAHGELGMGNNTASGSTPGQEATKAADWAAVSAGTSHSCAVKKGGDLYCWGQNGSGELGVGSANTPSNTPVQESSKATDWAGVSAGNLYTCATKTNGTLYCWGRNNVSQLGDGTTVSKNSPTQVGQDTDWAGVSTGSAHTCAIKKDGAVYCWGDNSLKALGTNNNQSSSVPVQEVTRATDWADVSVGWNFTCALKKGGAVYCWGFNDAGQLGTGSTTESGTPVPEKTGSTDWAAISAGWYHACALKKGGTIYCWGARGDGQLGTGDSKTSSVPVQESTNAADWTGVSAGSSHTCAVKNGHVYCWGSNQFGELGVGNTADSNTPVQVK